jgi:hypothetical protein
VSQVVCPTAPSQVAVTTTLPVVPLWRQARALDSDVAVTAASTTTNDRRCGNGHGACADPTTARGLQRHVARASTRHQSSARTVAIIRTVGVSPAATRELLSSHKILQLKLIALLPCPSLRPCFTVVLALTLG